jgi:RNA polymerase sigma factor (sigma-70 family)
MRTEDGYIINKCLNGDSAAFGLLVDKYKEGIYALAYSKLHNFHDAEDVTQEVFIKAYQKLNSLKRWENFLAWLYAITSNLCKDRIRTQARRPDCEFVEDQNPSIIYQPSLDSYRKGLEYESISEKLNEALNALPEIHRQVLTLRYLGGMDNREIARFLGTSADNISHRLKRAKSRLKEEMLTIITTTFEHQRLPAGFTLRIVETVSRIMIQPMPRTPCLPWSLSATTGIIITFLSLNILCQTSLFNSNEYKQIIAMERKMVNVGTLPVDVLELSNVSLIFNNRMDSEKDKLETSNPSGKILWTLIPTMNLRLPSAHVKYPEESQWLPIQSDLKMDFFKVCFVDDLTGWAIGNTEHGSRIVYTKDGGKKWTNQTDNIACNLKDIFFINIDEGWAVGSTDGILKKGIIFHTSDSGQNWKCQFSITGNALRCVFFLDKYEGWVVGDEGTILYTNNGGVVWKKQVSPTNKELAGVTFVNSRDGWIIGKNGTILHTNDGGIIWKTQKSGTISNLNAVTFVNAKQGWIVGKCGTVLKTYDGTLWIAQNTPTKNNLLDVAFADECQGWAVGNQGIILNTTDGGANWIVQPSNVSDWLTGLSYTNDNVWVVGSNGVVMKRR